LSLSENSNLSQYFALKMVFHIQKSLEFPITKHMLGDPELSLGQALFIYMNTPQLAVGMRALEY
jgi:hypothetical protein